jgi:hypothetical protein
LYRYASGTTLFADVWVVPTSAARKAGGAVYKLRIELNLQLEIAWLQPLNLRCDFLVSTLERKMRFPGLV